MFNLKLKVPAPSLVEKFFSIFKKAVKESRREAARKIAKDIQTMTINAILNQEFAKDWPPLNHKYAAYKKRESLDSRMLIATSFYVNHIEVWEDESSVYVGIKPGTMHPGTPKHPKDIPLARIALIHEFGNSKIPPRPVWRPVLQKIIRDRQIYTDVYSNIIIDIIIKAYKDMVR